MAPKRKAPKNPKSIPEKTVAARRDSKATLQAASADTSSAINPFHPYARLSAPERRAFDRVNYGFKNVKPPVFGPVSRTPRQQLPTDHEFVEEYMNLMQDKLFQLREYFKPEVQALIWDNENRSPRKPTKLAVLAEAANKGVLRVSPGALDCIRLDMYYAALFKMEGEDDGDKDQKWQTDRAWNELNRRVIWNTLKAEIADQMPGEAQEVRDRRAELLLKRAVRLDFEEPPTDEDEDEDNDETEQVDDDMEDVSEVQEAVVEEQQAENVAPSSSSDYDSSSSDY